MIRGEVLDLAMRTINGERQDQYGNPEDNFAIIAEFWNVYDKARNGAKDGPHDAAMKQALLKIARIATGSGKDDNYVDLCGYAALAHDIYKREREQRQEYLEDLASALSGEDSEGN